jgi:arylformamidase
MPVLMDREFPVDPDLEKGYNVSLSRSDFPNLFSVWSSRSENFRAGADARLDCVYDDGPSDRIDLFRCGDSNAPLLVFIHGGYWQRGDKAVFGFIAEPFIGAGVDVAMVGYQLCPRTDMSSIASQIRKAIVWLWRNASQLGISAKRINLCGHSAGGQLTGMMLATQWREIASDVPSDLIKTGIPISGLYQLEPLLHTTINDALGMDSSVAHDNSPQFLKPTSDAPVLATLGGGETTQFHWQLDQFVEQWRTYGLSIQTFIEPSVDHFDVINRLAEHDSSIFQKVRSWLR